jgi:hypothetical protein
MSALSPRTDTTDEIVSSEGRLKPGKISAAKAVIIGHLLVNVPVIALVVILSVVGMVMFGRAGFYGGAFIGAVVGWLWWSLTVPRWRRWALKRGAPPDKLQTLAQRTGLVWKKGSVLESTEIEW